MELRDVDYFAVVARHRNVGRAAEALGLSTPAVSLSLRRLESAVQAKLFTRTAKGVELTEAGAALLAQVQRLQNSRDDVLREIADLARGHAGRLHVGAGAGAPEVLAAAAAGALLTEAPKLRLDVTVLPPAALEQALRDSTIDLAVTSTSATPRSGFAYLPVFQDVFVVCASSRHHLVKRQAITVADLAHERWALWPDSQGFQALHQKFQEVGLEGPCIAMASNSATTRLKAVGSSQLLTFVPRHFLRPYRRAFDLTELRGQRVTAPRRVAVTYRASGYLSPAAKRFMEIVKSSASLSFRSRH